MSTPWKFGISYRRWESKFSRLFLDGDRKRPNDFAEGPAVDTELNPGGRAKRGNFKANLTPREFVSGVMKGLQNDAFEIGYGMTEGLIQASRAELDKSFEQMNSRM